MTETAGSRGLKGPFLQFWFRSVLQLKRTNLEKYLDRHHVQFLELSFGSTTILGEGGVPGRKEVEFRKCSTRNLYREYVSVTTTSGLKFSFTRKLAIVLVVFNQNNEYCSILKYLKSLSKVRY